MLAVKSLAWWVAAIAVTLLVLVLVFRGIEAARAPELSLWHTFAPDEPSAAELDRLGWTDYLARETAVFSAVRTNVTERLAPIDRVPANRYYAESPLHPPRFATDWNRSYVMEPAATAIGAVVLLHGLTDSPYSLRHVAERYRTAGWVAIAIRMPGHGTVPGGLTNVHWKDWAAATRLALREARRRIGADKPLHVVGFSNGGALAMQAALAALDDRSLTRADRIVLISPMIGVTAFARFAGVLGWPAVFPAFANAAWLGVLPEFNPFKYNSFPVNGARQSSLLTREIRDRIAARARDGRIGELPPILTFQSVVDYTVSTPAVISVLYSNLQANGSELVLFDINRNAVVGPLLRPEGETTFDRLVPAPPRRYATTLVTNDPADPQALARRVEAGASAERVEPLGVAYPRELFSLSHVAIPFPVSDALYGSNPSNTEGFGVNLGTIAPRGEPGALIVGMDTLLRTSSNPFFEFMMGRIAAGIAASASARR